MCRPTSKAFISKLIYKHFLNRSRSESSHLGCATAGAIFSPRRPGFTLRSVHMEFVTGGTDTGLSPSSVSPLNIIPLPFHIHSYTIWGMNKGRSEAQFLGFICSLNLPQECPSAGTYGAFAGGRREESVTLTTRLTTGLSCWFMSRREFLLL